MGKFFEAISNIFRIPDLRKRVLFTFAMLAVYRFGSFVPTPGIDTNRWADFLTRQSGSILGFFDLFAGGNIRRLSVFALGIMPYITASIILQLLTVVVPTLEKAAEGRRTGPPQDNPVDTLSHRRSRHRAVFRNLHGIADHAGQHCHQSGRRLRSA